MILINVPFPFPDDWHLPTDWEWKVLEMNLGMTQTEADVIGYRGTDQGDQLKTAADCSGGVNCGSSGFQALFAGVRSTEVGSFFNRGGIAVVWSSTESGSSAWYRNLISSEARVNRRTINKALGFSVRCVKD